MNPEILFFINAETTIDPDLKSELNRYHVQLGFFFIEIDIDQWQEKKM